MLLITDVFHSLPWLYFSLVFLFSLMIGSFLNVVIHRLPIMLEREWQAEYLGYFNPETLPQQEERYNLMVPRSACPHCGHAITAMENIPLLSWLWLKGRCRECQAPISVRYPLVELLTALLSLVVAATFAPGWGLLAALLLTWVLVALTFIDLDKMLLPDQLTLPLLWGGLLFNLAGGFIPLADAVIGAMAGYLVLWSLYWAFKLLTGKEGMGYGDFKLLAALGAWLGWQALPIVLLLSSLVGAFIGIGLILLRNHHQNKPIPFGPYLAIAGWIALLWGDTITRWYLTTFL
ncbi:prepilin peptidase [Aeromonas hydrophila]|uniref:Prepilin leader peptidase/N-methyltransferase n=1 Tax=Aeromonas hydrophila subsp. hydrophila (strain ATCC 7966 / DSM 30187 / BCRC 13018 / CCUG 14551 / JCM 1027 / KCTC 2358 / NCIMB 9240 / NCTC 8049) TaxID=380703 RepID=A0KPV9_AERHH|nr:A24 family peptidase [Aeromonas hydrophila]ABK35966.1 prepilin peptidase [Aeromonas hydrophila subsp. hydrophila ATCC 7966]MBS4672448.1 prepilin peptidase [Aeromonas hydrophila]OOD35045.1 prepilin peptidase [Aeromonas hydrophila]SUU32810.1 prepilin peptidase [Aeromonas hydrophila]